MHEELQKGMKMDTNYTFEAPSGATGPVDTQPSGLSLMSAWRGDPLQVPESPEFSLKIKTYNPHALADEVMSGAKPIVIGERTLTSGVSVAWNMGYRDAGLPPALNGPIQAGPPAPASKLR